MENKGMVINNNNAFLMAMGEGSRIEIHAADAKKDSWSQLNQTANKGAKQITLAETTGWEVGDKIAIASSSFKMDQAEERTIVGVSADGKTFTLDRALDNMHYGEIDTYNNGKSGGARETWDLDMRAEVALLSRNVTIQGDADSSKDGYGGHTMVMNGAAMHIDGAELTKMGQAGILGKYPLHWHMLGDATGQYVTNTSIHDTFNKGMTIHGTQNTWVENNAIYNNVGHTYYFEDGSEFGNVLVNNLGMNTRATENVDAGPIGSDHTAVSTYWVTNPDNHLIDNHAAGSDKVGFWILAQDHTEGASATSGLYDDYVPRSQNPGQWVGNSSHSNREDGLFIGRQFDEETGRSAGDLEMGRPYEVTDFTTYKNEKVGIWVRNGSGVFEDIKVAESNKAAQIWGASRVEDSLIVGASDIYEYRPGGEFHGWELYDRASYFKDVHFDGFDGRADAAIAGGDGFGRSANNGAENITFGDNVSPANTFFAKNQFSGLFSTGGGGLAGALHDVDGSISGEAGAILTPAIRDLNGTQKVEVLDRAFSNVEAAGFNAAYGATASDFVSDSNRWDNPAGSVIGKMNFLDSSKASERNDFTIARSDNGAKIFYSKDGQKGNGRAQLVLDGSGEVEYVVEYPNGLPETIKLQAVELPKDASAYFRFKGLPDDVVLQDADKVNDQRALENAKATSWYRDGNGDFVVKIFADRFDSFRAPNDNLPGISDEIYSDGFNIVISGRSSAKPRGNQSPVEPPKPIDLRPEPNPTPLPQRAESTSDTAIMRNDDARWSERSSWDNGVPDSNDIVIISQGMRVVLDTDVAVKGILVAGGELIVADERDLELAADWVLVTNGGLFQVGTEDNPHQSDFTLTLEGDDKNFDLDVGAVLASRDANTVRATQAPGSGAPVQPQPTPEPEPEPQPEPQDPLPGEDGEVIARINAGGERIAATDGGIDWAADNQSTPGTSLAGFAVSPGSSVPSSTPAGVFQSERWDNADAGDLSYDFAVANGDYEVRLYVGEGYSGTSAPGGRIFDVRLEGQTPAALNDIDASSLFGFETGGVISATTTVTDGELNIDFLRGVQNPMVNGIEIIARDLTSLSGAATVGGEISDGAGGAEIAVTVVAPPAEPIDPAPTDPPVFHRVVGDALANLLKGSKGADWMDGGAGDDTLRGDAGNDEAYGGGRA